MDIDIGRYAPVPAGFEKYYSRILGYILKTIPQNFSFISDKLTYITVSEAYAKLFNLPVEQFIGKKVSEIIEHDLFVNEVQPRILRCLAGETLNYDLRMYFERIGTRWIHIQYFPFRDEEGRVSGVLSHGTDITERKDAMSGLLRFKTLADKALYGLAMADLEENIFYINDYFAELHGYNACEITGKSLLVLHNEKQFQAIREINKNLLKGGGYESLEVWHTHRNGTEFPMLMSGQVIYDEEGAPDCIVITALDLTELKVAEHWLKFNEIKYRNLFNTTTDTITLVSIDGVITEVNKSACVKLGRRREEMIGKPVTVIDPDYTPESFMEFWKEIPLDKQVLFESRNITKTGETFPVEISGKKYSMDNKIYVLSIARDITERTMDRKRILEALRKAETADKLKSSFLANMSHEIRTPLNGILGFASLLNDPEITSEKQAKYYDIIKKSGDRLLNTINDLIDISKIESGLVEIEISEHKINSLLDELYGFFIRVVEDKGIKFKLYKPVSGDGPVIMTDGEKLYAIVLNLLKNALKFTSEGSIEFGYEITDIGYKFFVRDTGIGIPEDKIDQIFQRFVQAEAPYVKTYQGSGLGLSICKEYTHLLGGNISVESVEGKGAVFYVELPH